MGIGCIVKRLIVVGLVLDCLIDFVVLAGGTAAVTLYSPEGLILLIGQVFTK